MVTTTNTNPDWRYNLPSALDTQGGCLARLGLRRNSG
jgi:hypothetical protein